MSFTVGTPTVSTSGPAVASINAVVTGVPAGSAIVAFVGGSTGNSATNATISDGSSYTIVGGLGSLAPYFANVGVLTAASGGSHTVTATYVGGTSSAYLAAFYVSGANLTDGANNDPQNFPGTGANILLGGSITPVTSGDLIIGMFWNTFTGVTLTAGTSPNAFSNNFTDTTNGFLLESFLQSTAATINPTAGTPTSNSFINFSLALTPAATAAPGLFYYRRNVLYFI